MNTQTIIFVLTSRSGLGHIRRVTTIASAIKSLAPSVRLELLTNASPDGLAAEEASIYSQIHCAERAQMATVIQSVSSQLVVLDTIEVPYIEACPQRRILLLRETPTEQIGRFTLAGNQAWDRVLVPNPENHWMPPFPAEQAREVYATGWIYRSAGIRRKDEPSSGFLVATGGGGNEATRLILYKSIDSILTVLRDLVTDKLTIRQAVGPRSLNAALLRAADEIVDPGNKLNELFRTADLVISTAGYNSVLELATSDTPTLLVPIPRSIDDQLARVRQWGARLGYGLCDDNFRQAALWLHQQLNTKKRRKPVSLGPSGEFLAAELILELL